MEPVTIHLDSQINSTLIHYPMNHPKIEAVPPFGIVTFLEGIPIDTEL
jgi:hypothetical protein